jgi:hypothetical protein
MELFARIMPKRLLGVQTKIWQPALASGGVAMDELNAQIVARRENGLSVTFHPASIATWGWRSPAASSEARRSAAPCCEQLPARSCCCASLSLPAQLAGRAFRIRITALASQRLDTADRACAWTGHLPRCARMRFAFRRGSCSVVSGALSGPNRASLACGWYHGARRCVRQHGTRALRQATRVAIP